MVLGVYAEDGTMAGAARVVTDRATFAWVCDLFVLPGHRGLGLGRALVEGIVSHPDLAEVKRMLLATADAHGLYSRYGFEPLAAPKRWMELGGTTV